MTENGHTLKVPGQPIIRIEIIFDPSTGRINLSGPIADKVLCLGLLECAKQVVNDFSSKQQSNILIPDLALGANRAI